MQRYIEEYLRDITVRAGLSHKTAATYRSHLQLLAAWITEHLGRPSLVSDLSLALLQTYDTVQKRNRLTQRTRASRSCAIRAFARWLGARQALPADVADAICGGLKVKVTEAAKRPCASDEQVYALFRACEALPTTRRYRPRLCAAVVAVMAYAGLRRAEVCALKIDDVVLESGYGLITVRQGKGNKTRVVPLHPEAVRYLRGWLEFRPLGLPDLFAVAICRVDGTPAVVPFGDNRLLGVLRELCKIAGFPTLVPHSFRRFFATRLLEVPGCTIVDVQLALGHSDPSTTYRYVNSSQGKLRKLVNGMVIGAPEPVATPVPRRAEHGMIRRAAFRR